MNSTGRVLIEVRAGNDGVMINDCKGRNMQFWTDKQLIEALQLRLKKSEPEVRQLLESYHPSTSNL